MIYEIATLTIKLGTAPKAIAGIGDYVKAPAAKGTLLGCWQPKSAISTGSWCCAVSPIMPNFSPSANASCRPTNHSAPGTLSPLWTSTATRHFHFCHR